ncbi:MAG: YggS family pyridoxal phosphate-dependent enzyme [Alphaproteobacteria bacterium]|nr:YggS family pyridoxal phosphate-dependent enzyme [Alphaproteobacteria bacterium]
MPLISNILAQMITAQKASPLAAPEISLLAASKSQSALLIEEAIAGGVRVFGENRVQEAQDKWPSLRLAHPEVELHLIGPLQTNKVKQALELFDVIQTVDRPKLAEEVASLLSSVSSKKNAGDWKLATKSFYIQVNTGKEPQKAGVLPDEADAFIDYCVKELALPVVGLMCVPPADQPPAPHFALLSQIAQRHGLEKLSMGMSEDFETAIRMGSTCVRLGRALFGERA